MKRTVVVASIGIFFSTIFALTVVFLILSYGNNSVEGSIDSLEKANTEKYIAYNQSVIEDIEQIPIFSGDISAYELTWLMEEGHTDVRIFYGNGDISNIKILFDDKKELHKDILMQNEAVYINTIFLEDDNEITESEELYEAVLFYKGDFLYEVYPYSQIRLKEAYELPKSDMTYLDLSDIGLSKYLQPTLMPTDSEYIRTRIVKIPEYQSMSFFFSQKDGNYNTNLMISSKYEGLKEKTYHNNFKAFNLDYYSEEKIKIGSKEGKYYEGKYSNYIQKGLYFESEDYEYMVITEGTKNEGNTKSNLSKIGESYQ